MLVQLALIAFGMFGILAAIVDMGFVRLTQVEMQVAADSAAVEGLRARDAMTDGTGQPAGFASDCNRRQTTRQFVQWTFDDDFDLSGDARSFGAGPNIKFTGGAEDLSAYQFMSIPAADDPDPAFRGGRTFKPFLQLNQSTNETYGDMVSGTFAPGAPLIIDSTGQPVPGLFEYGASALPDHPEYERTDFTALAPIPDPGMTGDCEAVVLSLSPPIPDNSFLVRFRRTNVANDPDLDNVDGISSRGASLPLLFGRGTLIQDTDSGYLPRRDGITVRATAIADAKPVVRVGAEPDPATGRLQLTSECFLALRMSAGPRPATIDVMTGAVTTAACAPNALNFINPATVIPLGQPAAPASSLLPACPDPAVTNTRVLFGAVVAAVEMTDRVVGFAGITMSWADCAADPSTITVTLSRTEAPYIAPGNANALLDPTFPFGDMVFVSAAHEFAYDMDGNPQPGAMFAPVLVR